MKKTPVLLILFNRTKYTTSIIRKIKKYSPNKIYIHCDGPREDNLSDKKKCKKIRDIIKKEITWRCKKKIIFQKKNIGLRESVILAINFLFKNETKGIILEDSMLPNKSFFLFCHELLIKYKKNKKISMISGFNPVIDYKIKKSYTFSEYPSIWGWATWKRSWHLFDCKMNNWPQNKKAKWMKHKLKKTFFFRFYWEKIFQDAFLKKNKTWDYNLVYSNWFHKTWSIIPQYNLVENQDIYDKITTHQNNFKFKIKKKELKFPLDHPQKFSVNSDYDKIFYKKFYNYKFFFLNIFIARIFKKLLSKIYLKNLFDI
jgi:hypothetical protein